MNLRSLRSKLQEVLASSDETKIKEGTRLLQNWKYVRKTLLPKTESLTITNSNINNITFNLNDASSSAQINQDKRPLEVADNSRSSDYNTWNTLEKPKKKRKYMCTYLNGFYCDSNFGINSEWIVDDTSVTDIFRAFRQKSIEGVQMRRYLSNSRILSLSYIFLLSAADNCTVSKFLPNKQRAIITSALKKTVTTY